MDGNDSKLNLHHYCICSEREMERQESNGCVHGQGSSRGLGTGAPFLQQAAFIGNSSTKPTKPHNVVRADEKESCPPTPAESSASTSCFGKRGHSTAMTHIPIWFQEQCEAVVPVSFLSVLARSLHSSKQYFLIYSNDKRLKRRQMKQVLRAPCYCAIITMQICNRIDC